MNRRHVLGGFVLMGLVAAGCSSLPGLRVLTGQVSGQDTTQQTVETSDLVMADKTGMGDPSIMAAADRIEAAAGNIADVIEIRRDDIDNSFVVNVVMAPPNYDPNDVNAQVQYLDNIRRVIELVWQGTLRESEGSGILQVNVLVSQTVPTLDTGEGHVGIVLVTTQIDRQDAIQYLSHLPHTFQDFGTLILDGTMQFDSPQNLYTGQPNHPMFMRNSSVPGP